MRRRNRRDELDDLPLDAEGRAALAQLTPEDRADLIAFGRELDAALAARKPTSDPDTLPDDPGLPETYEGALVMGRWRRKRKR